MLKDELWSFELGITGQKRFFSDLKEYDWNEIERIKKIGAKRKKGDKDEDEHSE